MPGTRECPDCCAYGHCRIEWHTPDAVYGPEKEGWAIINGTEDYGAAFHYCNISFCPWCGTKLP